MDLLSIAQQAAFRQAINNASDTFNKQLIDWKHLVKKLDYYGDDRAGNTSYTTIPLRVLVEYNAWNVLPVDRLNTDGVTDKETIVLIFNKDYLRALGYVDTVNNRFTFDAAYDRFILNGITYKNLGDTPASQGFDDALLEYIICAKDETATGF